MPLAAGDTVILTIGLPPGVDLGLVDAGRAVVVVARAFNALSAELLNELRPVMVLTPLISRGFDAELVAQILSGLGYGGHLRVLCPALPDPRMIAREIRAKAPGLTVDLIVPASGSSAGLTSRDYHA
ncbi:MAG: hypothetical protein V4712_01685 [Pseudomonadota bacterium]